MDNKVQLPRAAPALCEEHYKTGNTTLKSLTFSMQMTHAKGSVVADNSVGCGAFRVHEVWKPVWA